MGLLMKYQFEIFAGAVALVAIYLAALILDYLLNHSRIIREQDRQARIWRLARRRMKSGNPAWITAPATASAAIRRQLRTLTDEAGVAVRGRDSFYQRLRGRLRSSRRVAGKTRSSIWLHDGRS